MPLVIHRHQVAAGGVLETEQRVCLDLFAGVGNPRRAGEPRSRCVSVGLVGTTWIFPLAAVGVVVTGFLG